MSRPGWPESFIIIYMSNAPTVKPVAVFLLLLPLVALASQSATADVLVLKSGVRYQGEVVDDGENYIVVLPGGARLPFPKDLVATVIKGGLPKPKGGEGPAAKTGPDPAKGTPPGMTGQNQVVLVVNTNSKYAGRIARNYCRARRVPTANVVKVGMPVGAAITRDNYSKLLLAPVQRYLSRNKHTTIILLVRGIPWRIGESGRSKDKRRYSGWDRASVDSELALAKYGEYNIEGKIRNPLYNQAARLTAESRVFGVCRLDGPDDRVANALVARAIAAEKKGVEGIAFFDARGLKSGAYVSGDRSILRAADIARKDGRLKVVVDQREAVVDLSAIRQKIGFYYGWYAGHFRPKNKSFRFGRGAVAAHLHSFAAYGIEAGRWWVGPLLLHGATATVGTADEPLLDGFPMPDPLIDALLKGCNFAEASLSSSRYLSWMSVNIGDPLYRPFRPKE